ncbi:MAG: polysaccharide deacetylase family protein [Verrucomicrobia bacterium]|nr:polysaccharide deacetylase family protein [Verrucomicrobiota bacterium]
MPDAMPLYYSSLAPFHGAFSAGLPVLTYHKVGPRPRGARIKGLTVRAELFSKQLAELRAAGFVPATLDAFASGAPLPANRIVITFDDGFRSVLEHALAPLKEHGFVAVQFLCASLLGKTNEWDVAQGEVAEPLMDAAEVRDWLAAGHQIGSHTLSHAWLTRLPRDAVREEITASKKKLEDTFGVRVEHFCYPYGDWNAAVRDLVIEAGYTTACTTERGVNTGGTNRFELRRFTARYASRNWKNAKLWLKGKMGLA